MSLLLCCSKTSLETFNRYSRGRKKHHKDFVLEKSNANSELHDSFQSLRIDSLYLSDEDFDPSSNIRDEKQTGFLSMKTGTNAVESLSLSSSRLSMMNVSDFSSSNSSSSNLSSSSSLHPKTKFLLSTIFRNSKSESGTLWWKRRYSDPVAGGTVGGTRN